MEVEAITLLRSLRLVRAGEVVNGDLRVIERWGRHHSLAVLRKDGGGYLLKEAGAGSAAEIAHEAAFYDWAWRHSRFSLKSLLPRRRGQGRWLVLDWVPGSVALAEHLEKRGRIGVPAAAKLGEAVAAIHRTPLVGLPRGPRPCRTPPWVLSLHHAELAGLARVGAGALELVRLCQSSPALGFELDRLRAGWSREHLVHRDLRAENCLLGQGRNGPTIHVVDWEWAGPGDPAWDVASVFASFLQAWVLSIPFVSGRDLGDAVQDARFPLERMTPGLQRFWTSYARGTAKQQRRTFLSRVASYTGACLLQSCWEWGQNEPELGVYHYVLQLAANLLADPHRAVERLLGLV